MQEMPTWLHQMQVIFLELKIKNKEKGVFAQVISMDHQEDEMEAPSSLYLRGY